MIDALVSLVVATQAAPTLPDAEVDSIVSVFRDACMSGKVTFKTGTARKITLKGIPYEVREGIRSTRSQQIFQFSSPDPAYLITFDQKPGGYYYPQACIVTARNLPFMATWEKVLRVSFNTEQRRLLVDNTSHEYIEFPIPEEGKKISIRRLWGPMVALQVSAMSKFENLDWSETRAVKTSPLSGSRAQ